MLLKPLKNQAAWKPVLARLKLLNSLIPVLDVGPRSLPPEGLMKFAGAAMGSSNADTRAAALAMAVQVSPPGSWKAGLLNMADCIWNHCVDHHCDKTK